MEDEPVDSLGVRNFLASRVQEINALTQQISNSTQQLNRGLAFQHVPKHMRRRAVSHNPKRLPKRLRRIHSNQIEKSGSGSGRKPKKPSSKYRRRKANLLEEYNRRQKTHKWLETHIWHAKRFHLESKWNYKIPISPTDKGYRALYRAANEYCTMRDISFYSCLQLEGSYNLISSKLSKAFAPPNCNPLTPAAELYKSGSREGSLYFFKKGHYPHGYIGQVKFQWKFDQSTIYLWVHPAHKEEIIEQLCTEFQLYPPLKVHSKIEIQLDKNNENEPMEIEDEFKAENMADEPERDNEAAGSMSIDELKMLPKNLENRPSWSNNSEDQTNNVILTDLEGVFNRIRLYGPMSTNVLKETLNVLSPNRLATAMDSTKNSWWRKYFSAENSNNFMTEQYELWKKLNNVCEVPRSSIIPLIVRDPRGQIPEKRMKVEFKNSLGNEGVRTSVIDETENKEDMGFESQLQKLSIESPIWNTAVRAALVEEKMSDADFSKRRGELLIPGSNIELGSDENQIPIVLIHRPSSKLHGFQNGGWDIIIPASWAMQFWVAFSYRNVRACGLRDAMTFEFESGSIHSEEGLLLNPDSLSGRRDANDVGSFMNKKYFLFPPAKRVNFTKFGCPFPFQISWSKLFKCQSTGDNSKEDFYVLRDEKLLEILQRMVMFQPISNIIDSAKLKNLVTTGGNCLVGVRVSIVSNGVIEPGAVICIPKLTDIPLTEKLENVKNLIAEPMQNDSSAQEARKKLTESHQKFLAFLRRKRNQLRTRAKEMGNDNVSLEDLAPYDSTKLCAIYNEKMNNLWIPDCESVLEKMTRDPIGFIVFGHESYSVGKCTGLGYCSLTGLQRLFETQKSESKGASTLVLVRNCKDSLMYRLARINICVLS